MKTICMEYVYDSYTKTIGGKTYYFVKKYMSFPELESSCNVQVGYGMHADFEMACNIAGIEDQVIRKQLMIGNGTHDGSAKIINFQESVFTKKKKIKLFR